MRPEKNITCQAPQFVQRHDRNTSGIETKREGERERRGEKGKTKSEE
jgi:hypothetical protein